MRAKIALVLAMFGLVACETLAAADKALYEATASVAQRDAVTGRLTPSFEDRAKQIAEADGDTKKGLSALAAEGLVRGTYYSNCLQAIGTPAERKCRVFSRVHKASHFRNELWTAVVIDKPGLNAFVLGGTYVFIHQEAWTTLPEAELAALFAHEIAHVAANHSFERQTILNLRMASGSRTAQSRVAAFSRVDEAEADKIGTMYLALSGFEPGAMSQLFERFSKQPSDSDVLATHPTSMERRRETAGLAVDARRHLTPGGADPQKVAELLSCNAVWCARPKDEMKPGQGAGFFNALEAAVEGIGKSQVAKSEEQKQAAEQELLALTTRLLKVRRTRQRAGGGLEVEFVWTGARAMRSIEIELVYLSEGGQERADHFVRSVLVLPTQSFVAAFPNARGKPTRWRVTDID